MTPISHRIARPLADGLRNRVVCVDPHPMTPPRFTARQAIDAALDEVDSDTVETSWSDAGVIPGDPDWAGGTIFLDERRIEVDATPADAFRAVQRVGGGHGYYAADWLWRIRGIMDRVLGGPGLRRGRRNASELAFGDALDFWRVTSVETDQRLALRAEMRLPGVAELSLRIEPKGEQVCEVVQTARFKPRGLLGLLYWYAVLPLHAIVFKGMLAGIRREAQRQPSALAKTSKT